MSDLIKILNFKMGADKNGFQYNEGLNVLDETFNPDPTRYNGGGLYVGERNHILDYIVCGSLVGDVSFPPEANVVKVEVLEGVYKANMLILKNIRPYTYKDLIEWGADKVNLEKAQEIIFHLGKTGKVEDGFKLIELFPALYSLNELKRGVIYGFECGLVTEESMLNFIDHLSYDDEVEDMVDEFDTLSLLELAERRGYQKLVEALI